MLKRDQARLDEIERQLLDETMPLAGALRKCVALGGELRSAPLREWASHELRGYEAPGAELPDYRLVVAPIMIDGAVPGGYVQQQRIAPSELPDFVKKDVSETVEIRSGVGTLEDLVRTANDDRLVKLSLPMGADIARIMNRHITGKIVDLYWGVSVSAIYSVIDRIRTTAVEIMSELRASAPATADVTGRCGPSCQCRVAGRQASSGNRQRHTGTEWLDRERSGPRQQGIVVDEDCRHLDSHWCRCSDHCGLHRVPAVAWIEPNCRRRERPVAMTGTQISAGRLSVCLVIHGSVRSVPAN